MRIQSICFAALMLLASCASYRQNIMFQVETDSGISQPLDGHYIIKPSDILLLEVFSNDGERIIDPDFLLMKDIPFEAMQFRPDYRYVVEPDGYVRLPKLGRIKVSGFDLRSAELMLGEKYAEYYTGSFVVLSAINRRVTVLGSMGGMVVPLENEETSIAEVLALAGGIDNFGKANNIRVIRGQEAFVVDLSTIARYNKTNVIVQPGDIIYVEPIRRPASEAMRDYGPIISTVATITSLIIVLISVR